jgi:hypothetical protein
MVETVFPVTVMVVTAFSVTTMMVTVLFHNSHGGDRKT